MIQIYFGSRLSDQKVIPVIKHMIQDLEVSRSRLTAKHKMYLGNNQQVESQRERFFAMLMLEYGVARNQAVLEWLNNVQLRLESGDYTPLELARLPDPHARAVEGERDSQFAENASGWVGAPNHINRFRIMMEKSHEELPLLTAIP